MFLLVETNFISDHEDRFCAAKCLGSSDNNEVSTNRLLTGMSLKNNMNISITRNLFLKETSI